MMRNKRSTPAGERGTALVIALFMSVLVLSWVGVAIGSNLARRNLGRTMHERTDAMTIAESGISLALYEIHTKEIPRSSLAEQLGPGRAEVTLEDNLDGTFLVTSRGRVGATSRTRHALITKAGVVPEFKWAILGHKKLKGKKAMVDSYDSNLGTYEDQWEARYKKDYVRDTKYDKTAKLLDTNATIGSNREINLHESRVGGSVLLPATVDEKKLDVRTPGQGLYKGQGKGPDWKVDLDKAYISDHLEVQDEPVIFPPIYKGDLLEVQTTNDNDLAYRTDGGIVYHDWNDKKDTGAKRLQVEGSSSVVILPAGTYYLDELKVKKDGKIVVQGPVRIWVGKKMEVDDGIFDVVSGNASDLEIIVAGHDVNADLKQKELDKLIDIFGPDIPEEELWKIGKGNVKFKHKGMFTGVVYAPTGKIKVESGADVCGSLMAMEVELKDGSNFHFDEALTYKTAGGGVLTSGTFIEARW